MSELNGVTGAPMSTANGYFPGFDNVGYYATDIFSVAIDGSGDVWMAGYDDANISELVGAATPTVTPLVVAAKNNKIGVKP